MYLLTFSRFQVFPAFERFHFLGSVESPKWSLFHEKGGLTREKYDDVKQIFPIVANGVVSYVGSKVIMGPSDDIEKFSIITEHLQPMTKLWLTLENVKLWIGLQGWEKSPLVGLKVSPKIEFS